MAKITNPINGLFTRESLMSLQGAAAATLLVPSVLTFLIGSSFRPYEKWAALATALIISAAVTVKARERGAVKWIIAALNGLLIYASAVGLTEIFSSMGGEQSFRAAFPAEDGSVPFFHSWYP